MKAEYSISIYLDTRRSKKNGKFPVKLTVYDANNQKQKRYPTIFDFTESEFDSIWLTSKPRNEYKPTRKKIQAVLDRAEEIAAELNPFTFQQFEKKLFRKKNDGLNINYHYDQMIFELVKRGRIGNASNYQLSRKSFNDFAANHYDQDFIKLTFMDITKDWLNDYEQYMIDKGRSLTTVSMYVRALRAIFNRAIDENEIKKEAYYPFGKKRYTIPSTKNVKKALNKEQLKTLYNAMPTTPEQEKAKDFWFFSFACNGMNIKDIALLRYKDIKNNEFEFYRAKTLNTSKAELKPITIYVTDFINTIIEKYGNDSSEKTNYVFDILTDGLTPYQQQAKIKNFTRLINQHLKKLCIANDLPAEISTYWARHSFATHAIRNGASMEFVQETLGHSDMKTTQNYFAGFDKETKKEFANTIMNFD